MVQKVDRPYWFNWLSWNLIGRYRKHKAAQRSTTWEFVNRLRQLPAGSLAIDCGANVGKITNAFVKRGFVVHAFEPDPLARSILERRFAQNPLVTIHAAGVGAETGAGTLFRKADFSRRQAKATVSSSLIRRPIHGEGDSVDVDVIDLAGFIRGLGQHVEVLKLDVEGAEVDVIHRLIDDGIYQEIGMIYAETHERHSADLAKRTLLLRHRIAEAGIKNISLDWK